MTVQVFPSDSTDPFVAILAIGDSMDQARHDRAKVDPPLAFRTAVIGIYIDALKTAMQQLASRTIGVFCPHALGTLRTAPATYKRDWDNDLHPTRFGFTKLAKGPQLTQLDALGFTRA